MFPNKVREMWREGKPVTMGWCSTPDPYVAEVMARSGFDALVLDMQHGMTIGPDRAGIWLQIVGQTAVVPIVRIPWNEPVFAQQVLDAGAMGIIVPLCSTLEDAKKGIGGCKYPPVGFRSNGPNRTGLVHTDYFAHANDEVLCLLMIETVDGLKNVEAFAQMPGCDGFYIGPSDLAISMGLKPSMDHKDPAHIAAVQKVIDAAKKYGKNAGIHLGSAEEGVRRYKQGFNFNPICTDIGALRQGVRESMEVFKAGVAK
jgi:4-hydroxy-2-oxoheptanedioate aldolase